MLIGLHFRRSACYPYQIKAGFDVVAAAEQRKLPLDPVFLARYTEYSTVEFKREYADLEQMMKFCLKRDRIICDSILVRDEAVRGQLSVMHELNKRNHHDSAEIAVNALNVFGRMESDKLGRLHATSIKLLDDFPSFSGSNYIWTLPPKCIPW